MSSIRKNPYFIAFSKAFSVALALAMLVQSLAPIQVSAALFNDGNIDYSYLEPTEDSGFTGTVDPSIAGCPVGKDCAVFLRNNAYGWDATSPLSGGAEYYGSAGVRSVCETSGQICREQGYEDVVCDPIAWEKAEWDSPSDNFQRDYVNGAWTTYGAWGGNDEYWTKITCQRTAAPVTPPQPPAPTDTLPIGYFDSASCSVFNGWTYDPDEPSVSNVVHFYADGPAGSGTFIGAMNVDQPRPDINTAYGVAGNHGFSFPTPVSLKDGGTHTIYAYGINTNPANPHTHNAVLPQAWNNLIDHRTISGCTTGSSLPPATISSLVTDVSTVTSGSSVTLSWASSDATSCTASGGWSGPVALSGSRVIGPLVTTATTTVTFGLSCTNASGNATQSTTISVVPSGSVVPPVSALTSVSISGVPVSIVIPTSGSTAVSVTSTATVSGPSALTQHGIEMRINGGAWQNAGAWNNPVANQARTTDASFTALNISVAGTYDFRTYASIDGGVSYVYSNSVSMPATSTPVTTAPSISSFGLTPSTIVSGSTATLSWASSDATSCTASGAWSGNKSSSGSETVGPFTTSATTTQTFTLTCVNGVGSDVESLVLTVLPSQTVVTNPVVSSFSVSPSTITSGSSASLTWATTGATSCTASGSWSGAVATAGTQTVGPFTTSATTTETFILTCANSVGTTTGSAVLTVVPVSIVVTAPSITSLSVSPNPIASGANATLTWATTGATSCTASGSWSGTVASSGSQVVGPFTVTAVTTESFTLACTNSAGSATSTTSLVVNPPGGTATGTVSVSVPVGLSTTEYGSSASFTVVLDSAPLALVTIPVSSSDTSEGTVAVSSLAFLPSNWNVPQTITVTGVDDALVDGDITYSILLGTAVSADINWNGINPSDVSIINFDNDSGTTTVATTTISAFSVSPSAITSGNTATLSWTSSNATLCVAGGSWAGNKAVTGSETVGPFTTTVPTTFTFDISCGNSLGTTTASTTLSVTPPATTVTTTTSGGGGGGRSGGPCIGYGCTPTGGSSVPADVWILIDTVSSGGGASGPAKVCKYDDFLTSFMKRGVSNNPNDVKKLQYFLNTYEAANLPVNGEFDLSTENAVKAFQVKYTESVLLPWGTTTPTGIVYITTTAEINRIFCGDNPEYRAGDLDNVLENVLYTPVDTTNEFEGVIGFETSSTSTSTAPQNPNIGAVFGSISAKVLDTLGAIPWYPLLIMILVLLGTGLVVHSILIKDIASGIAIVSLIRGSATLALGTLLNVGNTLAYILDPEWVVSRLDLSLAWLLGLDLGNLLAYAFLCLFLLAVLLARSMKKPVNLS